MLRGLAATLVAAGLAVLLFLVHEIVLSDLVTDRRQAELGVELREDWANPSVPDAAAPPSPSSVPVGAPVAVLHIPRLGADYERVVVEGVGGQELAQGPGHYPGTAMPGEPGNVALAGHRVGRGSPFLDLDLLRPGDPIVIETADTWFVYRVLGDPVTGDFAADRSGIPGRQIVAPTDVEVISPVPNGAPGAEPAGTYLTMTTCHPKYSARQRLVVHAALDGPGTSKAQAPDGPPSLHER